MEQKKIAMIIDDDEDFLKILSLAIRHPGFEVRTHVVDKSYQAIMEILKVRPYVLFMDFDLPRTTGNQILVTMRTLKELANLPVYFISGHAANEVLPFVRNLKYEGLLFKGTEFRQEMLKVLDKLSAAAPASAL